jgi:hypothetical protein
VADVCGAHNTLPIEMLDWPQPGAGGDGELSFISAWTPVEYDQFGNARSGIFNELAPGYIQGLSVSSEVQSLSGRGQDGIVLIAYRTC